MTFYQIQCFKEAATLLSITNAALRLHVTQPTLSRQIFMLEEELGAPLFTRSRNGLALTPAGKVFLEAAVMMLNYEQQVRKEVANAARPQISTLRIALLQESTIPDLLLHTIQVASKEFPEINIIISVLTARDLFQQLITGEIDLACTMQSQISGVSNIQYVKIQSDYMCLVSSENISIPPGEITAETLNHFIGDNVLFHIDHSSFDDMRASVELVSLLKNVKFLPSATSQFAHVVAGLGVSVVYYSHRLTTTSGINVRRIEGVPTSDVVLAYKSDNTNTGVATFLKLLETRK